MSVINSNSGVEGLKLIKCFYKPKSPSQARRHQLRVLYLILVPLLIDGDDDFGNVRDELIAFGFPQCLHADLQVLDQNLLKWEWRRNN